MALAVLAACMVLTAEASTLSKVTVMGRPYYRYDVKKGDTMYGVARELGWDINILQSTNQQQMTSLTKNAVLYYPAETDNEKVAAASAKKADKQGKQVRHHIRSGETLYSISRLYDVPVARLEELNPGSKNGIKADEWLLISDENKGNGGFHTIAPGETIYGVSKANGISVGALLSANPGISETNFRAGDVIRLPEAGSGLKMEPRMVTEQTLSGFKIYKVKKNDTWKSIAGAHGISAEELRNANRGVELKNKVIIGIPVIETRAVERQVADSDPRESTSDGLEEIYREVHGITATENHPEVRMAVLLEEPESRKDRQFMRGLLLAVNDLKNSGTRIALKAIDLGKGATAIGDDLSEFNPTLMATTAEKQVPAWLVDYSDTNNIPLVNTLDVKDISYQANPYMVQLITPSEYFNDRVAEWLHDKYTDYSLVFTGEEDPTDALASSLKSIWDPSKVRSRSIEDLKSMPLNERGKYLLYSYPVKRNEVSAFLDVVNEATTRTPLASVAVLGRPNWIVYDESLENKFHNNNVMIPARFYLPANERNNSRFAIEYRQMFDAAIPNSFPVYSALGYDVANYFIKGLAGAEGDINALPASHDTLQSDFSLARPSNWSGLLNTAVFMVQFTPYDTIEKNVIK